MSTASPSFAQSTWLVAEREIGSKLRSKSFVISFLILFLGALALVVWGGFSAGDDSGSPVAVTPDGPLEANAAMERAITETERRRAIQTAYNQAHGITPRTIVKEIRDTIEISER